MKPLKTSLFSFLLLFFGFNVQSQVKGNELFQKNCIACHTVGKGKVIGPDLKGISARRSEDWIIRFVKNSQDMIKAGDAQAVALFEENYKMVMPPQPLNDEEIREVLKYIAAEGGDSGAVSAPQANSTPAVPETAGDATNGEHLFLGMRRFSRGGPSCNSCHHLDFKNSIAGGSFSKNLTEAKTRLTEAGIKGILASLPFPAMKDAYGRDTLSKQEINDLVAFLGIVDDQKATATVKDLGTTLLLGGIIAATGLLILYSLVWVNRRRGSINQAIYDRQVKTE